jgi:hypothetical protein
MTVTAAEAEAEAEATAEEEEEEEIPFINEKALFDVVAVVLVVPVVPVVRVLVVAGVELINPKAERLLWILSRVDEGEG